jgi:hypothetical protein
MSERTVTQGSTSTLPPSVPPTVPPARNGQRPQPTTAPPTRVSTSSVRTATSGEGGVETAERPAERAGREARLASEKPAPKTKPPGPRRVRLAVSRVDPWSVMKLSFLLSIAIGIGMVVATATVWTVLNQMEVFAEIESIITEAEAMNQFGPILEYFEFSRVLSVATVIAVVDIVLITALSTLGAFVYNLVAAMVGGLHLTLTDD